MKRSFCSAALSEVMNPSHALAVLAYGTRHMDADLMDRSAEATLAIEFAASVSDVGHAFHAHPTMPEAVRDDYIESYSGDRFLDSIAYVRNYPADLADLSPRLGAISTPVQIIVGRDDPYALAADGKLLHEQLPHSRLDVFDCGHNAWEEEPDRYASVVSSWVEGGFRGA